MKKFLKYFCLALLIIASLYGAGRAYYWITDGFTLSNISSTFTYDPRWATRELSSTEKEQLDSILSQKFKYLGKGCQSYVFLSADGQYVLKFFKYQRFRVWPLLETLSFMPFIDEYRQGKVEKKRKKLEGFFGSWKLAFDELQPETGLVYVHLNKGEDLNRFIHISDKMGFEHTLQADQMEFLIQRKATMLCTYIKELMSQNRIHEAKALLSKINALIISEYLRGYADNDHALMQNTGVLDGKPIHIDVGQFVKDSRAPDPSFYKQELFNKNYKFRKWLKHHYPELLEYLETELKDLIGPNFYHMKPHFKPHD